MVFNKLHRYNRSYSVVTWHARLDVPGWSEQSPITDYALRGTDSGTMEDELNCLVPKVPVRCQESQSVLRGATHDAGCCRKWRH